MTDRNSRIGSTLESLLREDGFYEDVENEAIASVLAYKRGLARTELDKTTICGAWRSFGRQRRMAARLSSLREPE